MEQQKSDSEPNGFVVSSESKHSLLDDTEHKGYLGIIEDYKRQRDALKRRVEHLEFRLAQRTQKTQNLYQERKARFSDMQDRVYQIFLESPDVAWSYEDLQQEWESRYSKISSVNVPRRVKELTEKGLLWSVMDPESRKVLHYLELEEMEENERESS